MSLKGIRKFANVLSVMKKARSELIGMGHRQSDNQDILLGQLLLDAQESVKDRFIAETLKAKETGDGHSQGVA